MLYNSEDHIFDNVIHFFFRNRLNEPGGGASLASQQPSPVAAKHLEKEFAANLAYLLLASSTRPLDGKVWMCRYASVLDRKKRAHKTGTHRD